MLNKNSKLEKQDTSLMLLIFVGFVPFFLFIYWGVYPLTIYFNVDKYKIGKFYLLKLDCGMGDGSDDFNCYGYGTINNIKTSINLGKTPGINTIYKNPNYADLSSDTIAVFYRPDLRQTIVIRNNEEKIDKNKYLYKGIKNLIYPLIIYPFLIYLYRKTSKQLENEQKTS
ncbi:hypothetical protein G1K46_06040 [Tenacibaculum finnmarkense]|uniref:hypothetical protein n=1 Tax=Tenacibaculum finnmarkense TaxID=2781243 RepID=UPI001EFB4842|nr:hypothetical protein [Tenacibaculum finnmarkense]MCG8762302.1 hypothetical protein [Tenacibaculum finnmarkense]MCG8787678.1 hypothetical protein [Tenacibaculum finnmarkense]